MSAYLFVVFYATPVHSSRCEDLCRLYKRVDFRVFIGTVGTATARTDARTRNVVIPVVEPLVVASESTPVVDLSASNTLSFRADELEELTLEVHLVRVRLPSEPLDLGWVLAHPLVVVNDFLDG